jgi:hypothetical protein
MENLHPVQLTTNRGTFWFCGQKRSCEFFCRDEDCYIFTNAVENFRKSGPQYPVCPTHQKLAKLRTVKDKMKQNYGRPFFVCSKRENPCKFCEWGDVYKNPRPICQRGMVCCERKVKKDGRNQNRLFYCCPKDDACGFFELNGNNQSLVWSILASCYSVIHYNTDTRLK